MICKSIDKKEEPFENYLYIMTGFTGKLYESGYHGTGEKIFEAILRNTRDNSELYHFALLSRAKYSYPEGDKSRSKKDLFKVAASPCSNAIYNESLGESVPVPVDAEMQLVAMALRKIENIPDKNKPVKDKIIEEEIGRLETMLGRFPDSSLLLLALGNLHQNQDRYDKAKGYYQAAIAANPLNLTPYVYLYYIYCKEEAWGRAKKILADMNSAMNKIIENEYEPVPGGDRFDRFRMYSFYQSLLAIYSAYPSQEIESIIKLVLFTPAKKQAIQQLEKVLDDLRKKGLKIKTKIDVIIRRHK